MTEILAHSWMKGPIPTPQVVFEEFQNRHKIVQIKMEAEAQQKALEKE